VSQEDQQKIDMFMQNQQQQQRGRRRMPLRPSAPMRPLVRPLGFGTFGRPRFPGMQQRPLFPVRLGNRIPPFRPIGVGGNVPPTMRVPPRQKILVNPHFRGPTVSTPSVAEGPSAPSPQPASAFPKLMSMDVARPSQQHPQFTVSTALATDITLMPSGVEVFDVYDFGFYSVTANLENQETSRSLRTLQKMYCQS